MNSFKSFEKIIEQLKYDNYNAKKSNQQFQKACDFLATYEGKILNNEEQNILKKYKIELLDYRFKCTLRILLDTQKYGLNKTLNSWFFLFYQNLKKIKQHSSFATLKKISQNIINLSLQIDEKHFYMQEYWVQVRFAVRNSYIFLSLENVTKQPEKAAQYIQDCFQIKEGAFEYTEDAFKPYYEPRILIYLYLFEHHHKKYQAFFFDALMCLELEKTHYDHPIKQKNQGKSLSGNPLISAHFDSPAYYQYQHNHNVFKNFKRSKGETWQNALKRYFNVCKYFSLNLDDYFVVKNKVTTEALAIAEKEQNYKIPSALANLLIKQGAFNIFKYNPNTIPRAIQLYEIADFEELIPEFALWFEDELIEQIKIYYLFFGYTYLDDNTKIYYFFSKQEDKIGWIYFDQDSSDSYEQLATLIFNEMDKNIFCTLDELLSQEIDGSIQEIRINQAGINKTADCILNH